MDALKAALLKSLPPFILSSQIYDILGETPERMNDVFPSPTWTFAKKRKDGHSLPQAIAHRGYKAKHPENTMGAFRGAVAVGADGLETDIHLSEDGKVVLSHDATLERCFGHKERIADCKWKYISTLRTLEAPHEPMPLLSDLLEYLAAPGLEDVWLLLDIKVDNDADTVMRLIGETMRSVPPSPSRPWNKRIVLGIWAVKYLPLCAQHLPTFAVTHIGFSTAYARQFLSTPSVTFNTLQKVLFIWPSGPRFIGDAHRLNRSVVTWTVNDDEMMRWSINHGLDGVITDDPKRFREVCDDWIGGHRSVVVGWRAWMTVLWTWFMLSVFGWIFRWRMRGKGNSWVAKGGVGRVLEEEEVESTTGDGSAQPLRKATTESLAEVGRDGLANGVLTKE